MGPGKLGEAQARKLAELKSVLGPLWHAPQLTREDKERVIATVTSVVDRLRTLKGLRGTVMHQWAVALQSQGLKCQSAADLTEVLDRIRDAIRYRGEHDSRSTRTPCSRSLY